MQAVADCNYIFRDIVVGWPGSVHDARVLSNSHLYQLGNKDKLFVSSPEDILGTNVKPCIIGDPAYPLLPWLMKPYPQRPGISATQKNFNYRLSRARMTIENTFGRLKARFRRLLKQVDMTPRNVTLAVTCSCILHNVCELAHEEILEEWLEDVHTFTANNCDDDCIFQDLFADEDAEDIRDAIADYFLSGVGKYKGSGGS